MTCLIQDQTETWAVWAETWHSHLYWYYEMMWRNFPNQTFPENTFMQISSWWGTVHDHGLHWEAQSYASQLSAACTSSFHLLGLQPFGFPLPSPLPSSGPDPSNAKPHSHFVRAIAPVVHCCWHSHDQCRHAVADQIEVLPPGVFTLKNLHQHDVELHPLQEHPGESRQEEEVQEGSKDSTGNLQTSLKEQEKVFVLR